QHQRQKNGEQTKNRMRARLLNGYWCFAAPPGYKFQKVRGHGNLLVRDEPLASIYQEALEGFASGRFDTQAEVKRFLESQSVYTDGKKGGVVRFEDVIRLLTRPHYAGYIERPDWDVSLRKGHHEVIISLETYERIQERIKEGARVPARRDINTDFPLRGFVTCADCDNPLTACWSRSKTGKKHPYYMCFTKGCESYRKSIRRDALEGDFEALLKTLRPSRKLFHYFSVIFRREWELRADQMQEVKRLLRSDILKIDGQIEKLVDHIVDAESETAAAAYERWISKLEREKLIKEDKIATSTQPQRSFRDVFELAFGFLSSPWKIWESDGLAAKRTVLKLAFEDRLPYCRKTGLRTPKTTLAFKVLAGNGRTECEMAGGMGFEPTIPF
ncbi:MAG: recombinase zinc beta ribbon domain-containing protein, partial [Pseudomonadota bacterium]